MEQQSTKRITLGRRGRVAIGTGLVATAAAAAVAVGTVAPAYADIDRHGRYGSGHYEFSVDREHGGYEVSFDLEGVKAGSRWVVALRHDGRLITRKTITAHYDDGTGELSLERWARNTAGSDKFQVRFRQAGTQVYKSSTITVR